MLPSGKIQDQVIGILVIDWSQPLWQTALKLLVYLVIAFVLLAKSMFRVASGNRALKRRGDSAKQYRRNKYASVNGVKTLIHRKGDWIELDEGWHIGVPFADNLLPTSIKVRNLRLEPIIHDDLPGQYKALELVVVCRVVKLYPFLITYEDAEGLLGFVNLQVGRELLKRGTTISELPAAMMASKAIHDQAKEVGVEVQDILLPLANPTNATQTAFSLKAAGVGVIGPPVETLLGVLVKHLGLNQKSHGLSSGKDAEVVDIQPAA